MDSLSHRFWDGADGVRLLASEADLDHAGFVLHEEPDGFSPEVPHLSQIANAIAPLEGGSVGLCTRCSAPDRRTVPHMQGADLKNM